MQPIIRKPNRKELVLIGSAKGAVMNDRDHNRVVSILCPLEQGFNLCVEALRFDPPHITKSPKVK